MKSEFYKILMQELKKAKKDEKEFKEVLTEVAKSKKIVPTHVQRIMTTLFMKQEQRKSLEYILKAYKANKKKGDL